MDRRIPRGSLILRYSPIRAACHNGPMADSRREFTGGPVMCPACRHVFLPRAHRPESTEPPGAGDQSRAVFRREGEYWFIAYEGEVSRFRHSKGLGYLARLIANPGREMLALHLAQGPSDRAVPSTRTWRLGTEDGLRVFTPGDTGEVIDSRAQAAYQRRIRDLQEDLDESEAMADIERTAQIREELDVLSEHLAAALGLGGRVRRTTSQAERARQSVTKAIKSAADRIEEHCPALSRHLASTVRTGTYCIYDPDPRIPITWQT